MTTYKQLLNTLSNNPALRRLTEEEVRKLRAVFLEAFLDLKAVCEKMNLSLLLIGGSALGCVRHNGFIPWDDDMDVAMSRADFEQLKEVFDQELGEKYILSSPNYKNNANNRFPMILVKNTLLVEVENSPTDDVSKIKIDIFIIENIPSGSLHRLIKGCWCSFLMLIASYEETYERSNNVLREYMCKTNEGRRVYYRRIRIGRLFSFFKFQKWMNIIDSALQYKKETTLKGIPSGRGHYFGEIRPASTFFPPSNGRFEGIPVQLPGDVNDYLTNLYGSDYMVLPPVEKRERHLIMDLKFKE